MGSDKKKHSGRQAKAPAKEKAPRKQAQSSKNVSFRFSDSVGVRRPIDFVPPAARHIEEPHCMCALCSNPIDNISEAISWKEEGSYVHFDCMLEMLRQEYNPKDDEKISYIGRGTFALIRNKPEGGFEIVERIEVENQKTLESFRAYVDGIRK